MTCESQNPMPDFKQQLQYSDHIEHYQRDGEYYDFFSPDKFLLQEIRRRYQEFFHLYPVKNGDRILEIGSGGGFSTAVFEKSSPLYYPLDIPVGNLKRIRQLTATRVYPTSADAYQLPFQENVFQLVIMAEVLEHLSEPLQALREIRRILQPAGSLVISVPYKEKISYQICIHCNLPTPTHSHLHSFDETKLINLITDAGFRTVKITKNCNKIPNRLHLNHFMRKVPFRGWKVIDRIFNSIIDKPISIILLSQKN